MVEVYVVEIVFRDLTRNGDPLRSVVKVFDDASEASYYRRSVCVKKLVRSHPDNRIETWRLG